MGGVSDNHKPANLYGVARPACHAATKGRFLLAFRKDWERPLPGRAGDLDAGPWIEERNASQEADWRRDQNEMVPFRGVFSSARDRARERELVATHYFVFSM